LRTGKGLSAKKQEITKPNYLSVIKNIVLIPTYNEQENIEAIISAVIDQPIDLHLLIIDDNSPDGTASIVKKQQEKFPDRVHLLERSGKLGLGTAYIAGFKWALENGYDYIFEMDADFSHDPKDLVQLYYACTVEHADLAIGSRYKSGVNVVNWPMGRVLMSYFASVYVRTVTGMDIMDTTAGFKCYHRSVLETIDLDKIKFKGYAFQIEMKFSAWKYGFKIVEVPIVFTDRRKGASKMSGGIFNEAVWGVIKMKFSSFFKKYKRNANHTH
jgi:dolichol-phosphate mannosyltransferase